MSDEMTDRPLTPIPGRQYAHINYLTKYRHDRLPLLQGDGDTLYDSIGLLVEYDGSFLLSFLPLLVSWQGCCPAHGLSY